MKIKYPIEWDSYSEYEIECKGWLPGVELMLNDQIYQLTFYDPVRLAQDLADDIQSGKIAIVEKGLMVIPSITKENIIRAINQAVEEGYFC